MWLCACLTGIQPIAVQQNGQIRATGSNVTQLDAGNPIAEFLQTGHMNCPSVPWCCVLSTKWTTLIMWNPLRPSCVNCMEVSWLIQRGIFMYSDNTCPYMARLSMIFCDTCASRCWIVPHTIWTFHRVTFVWILVFWDVTFSHWVINSWCFEALSFLHLQRTSSLWLLNIILFLSTKDICLTIKELWSFRTGNQWHSVISQKNWILRDGAIRTLSLSMTSICLVTSRKKRLQILVGWQCQGPSSAVILALALAIDCRGDLLACVGGMPALTLRGLTPSHKQFPNSFHLRKSHTRLHKLIWVVGGWVWMMNFRLS
jgi:hypothetical protein